ncbi:MAG: DUF4474 domain-containing protein [Candidatus Fimenecus sp.]
MNTAVKRTLSLVLAVFLIVCSFASCKKNDGDEEITRSANGIAAPETTAQTTAATEDTTAETTTAEAETTTKKASTASSATSGNNTTTMQNSDKVNQAAQQSGVDVALAASLINALGYNYDSKEGVFYTELDSWQRSGNYIKHYDMIAPLGNMTYLTTKVDFNYDNLAWRIQFWKGQYGPFGGAEIGVYYKIPGQTDELYYCADDDHLLYMSYTLYLSPADYQSGKKFFTRGWQKHWWLTGFKAAQVDPEALVMSARIRTYDSTMRDAMEQGLIAAGFTKGNATTQMDTYKKSGFDFYILWHSAGATNYK